VSAAYARAKPNEKNNTELTKRNKIMYSLLLSLITETKENCALVQFNSFRSVRRTLNKLNKLWLLKAVDISSKTHINQSINP